MIAASIARTAGKKGRRVLFLVHRRELCEQISRTFTDCGVDMTLAHVCMVQTVARRPAREPVPDLILIDEAHHAAASSYRDIFAAFPDALRIGFTATPVRLGEGGLGQVFDALVESVSTRWLIDNGYLAPYRCYSYRLADTSGLHVRAGEYIASEVTGLMEKARIYGDTVETYRRLADRKRAIVYCASVTASQATAAAFRQAGYTALHLDAKTPAGERSAAVEAFRRGEAMVLCNVDLFGEGLDVPDCEVVILLRPTKSLALFIQQSMRSMRYRPGKLALIIDHVGNVFEHGLPDETRVWSLEGGRRKAKNSIHVRECPVCFTVAPARSDVCPACGYIWPEEARAALEEVDGELCEISASEVERRRLVRLPYLAYRELKSFDELHAFARARGYKFAWALRKCVELGLDMPDQYKYIARRYCHIS